MNYDKPAQLVWVANLTATGYVNSNFLQVIDTENSQPNVVNLYTDKGLLSSSTGDYFIDSNFLFSITDNNLNQNLTEFVWNFINYKGSIYPDTGMLAVNYFNNYTDYELAVIVNYNNQTISPPFYFDPFENSPNPTASKTFLIPANSKNFPIPLWVKPYDSDGNVTFTCLLSSTSTLTVNGSAIYTSV